MGFSMELHKTDAQLWVSLYPAQSAYRTCIEGNSVKNKELKSQTAAPSTHMAFTTGISWTQLESCKHEWSRGHYNLNCNSAYSEYCLSFMMWPHAPLLSNSSGAPRFSACKTECPNPSPTCSSRGPRAKSNAEPQLCCTQALGPLTPVGHSPGPPPHLLHTDTVARAMQTCSSPTPWAGWGLRELCATPQPAADKVRSFLRPLCRALSTHIATWAGHWVPGLGPCWRCKGKMVQLYGDFRAETSISSLGDVVAPWGGLRNWMGWCHIQIL